MEQVVRKFRTSLGGFNRRDVMSYIEEMYACLLYTSRCV